MKTNNNSRRNFLETVVLGTAVGGFSAFAGAVSAQPLSSAPAATPSDADEWFKKIKGKHRVVYDVTQPHGVFPFAWPRVFLLTNEATGTPENECNVVVVLRHDAIPYALENSLWPKYNFTEMFHAPDPMTGEPVSKNPFWKPAPGTFQFPGFGEVAIGIDQLQASGVMFCVCNAALTVYSAAAAQAMNLDAGEVYQEWSDGLLPDIQVVPSGVWALGRAQEHGCAYIFAG
ncbi:hypothetical protein [Negadavirga shengliensis]|uniref:Twin-arginine translocation signal domain-containing protein n=1 Tax=Negadavirga shengliensis TaxID=1389218 RepID=A0ABV9T877_9BACT